MVKYIVQRLDTNKENVTYNTWVTVAIFNTEEAAKAYVKRASSPAQELSYLRVDK